MICVPFACYVVIHANEFPVAIIQVHVFIIGLIRTAPSCTLRQPLHKDTAMSSGSMVVVVLVVVFPLPSTLSKMVASSPALTFDLWQPVLLLVPHWVLRAEGLKATPSRLSSVRVHMHAHTIDCQDAVAET